MKKWQVRLIKYGSCALGTALLAGLYVYLRDFPTLELVDQYRVLCDAFTVPGMVLLMVGALLWVSTQGALDGFVYAGLFAVRMLLPFVGNRDEKYADFVERRRNNKPKGYGFLLISGAVTMAIAMVFCALFYSVYTG